MKQNLILRILSALVLVPSFIISIIWFKTLYLGLLALVYIATLYEWFAMTKNTKYAPYGILILTPPIICLIALRLNNPTYIPTLMYFISIWSVDTFAMIGGKTFQGPKLAPKISPNKTWSGLICGCAASAISCYAIGTLLDFQDLPLNLMIYGFLNGLISQASDVFISFFKRKCNVKESGYFIPGHGGVLDRFDSIIFSAPFLMLLTSL